MTQGARDPVGTGETNSPDPDDALYQQAQYELRNPQPPRMTGLVFVVLFLIFLAGQFEGLKSPLGLGVLIAYSGDSDHLIRDRDHRFR
jgi:hypothetical protein